MPALNAAHTIEDQLAALASQRYEGPWELIVADNGSRDTTVEAALAWGDRIPGLRVIDASRQRGSWHARNDGTVEARGPLIAYCDADDVVGDQWVSRMAEALSQHGLVTGPIDLVRLNKSISYSWRGISGWDRLPNWLSFLPGAFGANLGVRREAFEAVSGFRDLTHGQDLDFAWRVQLAGFPLWFESGAVVHRRLPDTLRAYARKQFAYTQGEPLLFRYHRGRGMPRSSTAKALGKALLVAATAPLLLVPRQRYLWVTAASTRLGRMAGSVRHGVLYL
jgi:glycosyltransferase involved in cell wall biosynthesis